MDRRSMPRQSVTTANTLLSVHRQNDIHNRPQGDEQTITPEQVAEEVEQLKRLAWLMDDSIKIPVVGFRVGLDGLLGLIPGVGDLLSAGIASYVVARARKLGAPKVVILQMAGNVLIDAIVGSIPLLGDIFDFGWKANRRNLKLLVNHLEAPKSTQRASWWKVGGSIGLIIVAFVGLAAIIGASVSALF